MPSEYSNRFASRWKTLDLALTGRKGIRDDRSLLSDSSVDRVGPAREAGIGQVVHERRATKELHSAAGHVGQRRLVDT